MKSLFLSSGSNNTQSWVLLQRKIRDQGSNFSQETAKLATGVLTTEEIGISFHFIVLLVFLLHQKKMTESQIVHIFQRQSRQLPKPINPIL